VLLSVKFGAMRSPGVDGCPRAVKIFIAYSLQRLRISMFTVLRGSIRTFRLKIPLVRLPS
jgi:hypothetical protein